MNLKDVHPELMTKITKVLNQMAAEGHPMKICQGVRTASEQNDLWKQGRIRPGRIVTNINGYDQKSNHQVREDGFGHAVDCCFATGEPFSDSQPWARYGELVKAEGLKWGGEFKSLKDRPHAELA